MCRSVQCLPGKPALKTQPWEFHHFLKDSGDHGKALHAAAAKSSFTNNEIISVIIALYGQKLRKTLDDFYWRFKIGCSWCPGLYSPLHPPNFSFVLQQVFFHPGPAEQIPFGQFAISPPFLTCRSNLREPIVETDNELQQIMQEKMAR